MIQYSDKRNAYFSARACILATAGWNPLPLGGAKSSCEAVRFYKPSLGQRPSHQPRFFIHCTTRGYVRALLATKREPETELKPVFVKPSRIRVGIMPSGAHNAVEDGLTKNRRYIQGRCVCPGSGLEPELSCLNYISQGQQKRDYTSVFLQSYQTR